jgi:hypothetical protein
MTGENQTKTWVWEHSILYPRETLTKNAIQEFYPRIAEMMLGI